MGRPLLLDCYSGAGGAARGYVDAGFTVVGVDIAPQPRYLLSGAVEFHQGDALEFIREHGHEFDVIHCSPPCQAWVQFNQSGLNGATSHPELIEPTLRALAPFNVPWVVENVPTSPLKGLTLCGSSFGLRVRRHRRFASNVLLFGLPCDHSRQPEVIGVYGNGGPKNPGGCGRRYRNRDEASGAMGGLAWMTVAEMCEAIPPVYCKHIGSQLLSAVERRAA